MFATLETPRRMATLALLALLGTATGCAVIQERRAQMRGETLDHASQAETATATTTERSRPAATTETVPPLIDRDLFFGDPKIAGSQISPDGRWISFIKPYRGVMNIWVKERTEPFDDARPVTADTERPVTQYFWSEDSRTILYSQDKGGNENYHVYALDPSAPAEVATGVPPARDLTPLEGVRAAILAVPEGTPGEMLVGLNDRNPALFDVYRIDIETGDRELVVRNDSNVAGWMTDLDGEVRLAYRQTEDGGIEILRVADGTLGDAVVTCNFEESCYPLGFHKDGRRFYMSSNRGADVDRSRLVLVDVESGATDVVHEDPEGEVDFSGAVFSDRDDELLAVYYDGDRRRYYPLDPRFTRAMTTLRRQLPRGDLGFGPMSNDDRWVKVSVSSDVDPGTVYLFDWERGRVEKLYETRPELPSEHLAHMEPVRYPSLDGLEIPAYLTLPKGKEAGDLPAVILVHGGPWSRTQWGYSPFAQFLANRGYAVLQPNFRGSTGYGKAFLNAGNKEWGTGAMQHDITAAARYLVREGIAADDAIAIMGGSYGGYATLAGVTFTPDLYAAAVDIVGPSNIITLIDSFPPYWGPLIKVWHLRVGDPDDPRDRARLEAQSPLNFANRIETPLLVIQGANDPRVTQPESDRIVAALHDLGRDVEYLVAPDEGHGFLGRENRLAMFAKIEEFLATRLGGRYQRTMQPEVRDRLATLTVDPATVEPPKVMAASRGTAPLMVDPGMLEEMKLIYRSELTLPGDRDITMESTSSHVRAEHDGRSVWRIESGSQGPMGEATDIWLLDSETLRPIRRDAQQGIAVISVEYTDDAVDGSIDAGPRVIPVHENLDAPVYGDDAALSAVLVTLPLEEGYATTLRNFELRQGKVRPWAIEVEGSETVETPAGTYDAWKVSIHPLDGGLEGGTYWISRKAPRMVVRSIGKLSPQMGGGQVVTELVSRQSP